ncbi:conserved hypothetical protein [Coccidioides posadasii str. Silveira]|uniref:Uncharacterized protein n=1 Tax=Coccidioides posadasii (strain RMSCC 757 / Silveira) TaxID=443226 RepID=E9DK28_COCPS|nr:conserved hypothetical protein [Coccidioides posadasii str. Silveira]
MGKLLPRLKDKDLLGFGKSISRLRSVKRQPELDGSTTEKACASYESYLQRKGTKKLISQRQPGPHAASDISSDQLADPTHLLPTYTLRTLVRVELKLYRWNHRKVIQGAHNFNNGDFNNVVGRISCAHTPDQCAVTSGRGAWPRTSARPPGADARWPPDQCAIPPDVGARAPWSRCAMTPGPVRDDPRTSAR